MKTPELRTTDDGSKTLYNREIDECYHSTFGARNESSHIFIKSCLKESQASPISVLEIGFGTGLNAFLTALHSEESNTIIHYHTLELYPLSKEIYNQLNYATNDKELSLFEKLHTCEWEQTTQITNTFYLTKIKNDLQSVTFDSSFDCVYFDAFSPDKQPELWSQSVFDKIYNSMNKQGLLTTYCSKGIVRRTLQTIGFAVERIAGPIGGKREILRARK